jgi:neopullulanase
VNPHNPATAVASSRQVQTPEWVKDAVFYQIFPDRFAQSTAVAKPSNLEPWDSMPTTEGYKGGDLMGVVEKLDHLVELGVNAIYFNPLFQSASNHRYHTHDYFKVDPILGGNEALRHLINAAHARNIKVILDGVFNHCSRGFYQFNQALEIGEASPYLDWFHFEGFPVQAYNVTKPNYGAWWALPALPKFNTSTQAVREYLWSVGRYWIEFGADGWRLDVPNEIDDDDFWIEFRRQVKEVNPEAYICGEIWGDARRWLQGDQFDSVMNYLFTRACIAFFISDLDMTHILNTSYEGSVRSCDAATFSEAILEVLGLYHHEITAAQLNLLDSHDTSRFLTMAKGDTSALRLATLFQMCYPGAPSIYYGDEIGLPGGRDPDCRRSFPWEQEKWDLDLLDHFKKAVRLRHAHVALRRGDYNVLYADQGLYVFGRHTAQERLVIVLNVNSVDTPLPAIIDSNYFGDGLSLHDLWNEAGQTYTLRAGQASNIIIPARSGIVLEVVTA